MLDRMKAENVETSESNKNNFNYMTVVRKDDGKWAPKSKDLMDEKKCLPNAKLRFKIQKYSFESKKRKLNCHLTSKIDVNVRKCSPKWSGILKQQKDGENIIVEACEQQASFNNNENKNNMYSYNQKNAAEDSGIYNALGEC